ncbi:MAG TPA: DNA polymerase III subunit gamma/tau [Candidatus Omnitrophota bacterium]|nr:DNA polymerase III subunit gamma/tau [Candidatus Omnitrophota bacterium]
MTYQVFARKYRPQAFDEVIGQGHITDLLKKAIQNNRVAHAYLFAGPRGIGKTTCARILAMCLNATKGPTASPSTDDPICQDIIKGTSMDVIEIDGASNRGIDEIRALRENVKFAPSYGRFKIYIVDEVHMLTGEAFNALLKTLEEPPAHVKFIFATTEPHKVPATIISRCQRFDFKRISIQQMVEALGEVAQKEKLKIDEDALYAIAKAAEGSLRDGLSVLDQMSALSERNIRSDDVYSMLGLVETQYLFDLSQAIADKDCPGALRKLGEILDKGKDTKQLTKDLTEHFRHLMILKVGGKSLGKMVDYPLHYKEMLLTQTEHFGLRDILTAIDILIATQETARITETQRMPLELALAKLAFSDDIPAVREASGVKRPAPAQEETPVKASGGEKPHDPEVKIDIDKIMRLWDRLTHALSKEKMSLATYLQDAKPVDYKDRLLIIGFPKSCKFQKENLETKENVQTVQRVFESILQVPLRVKYEIVDDFKPKDEEPVVKNVLDTFGGQIVNRWHND